MTQTKPIQSSSVQRQPSLAVFRLLAFAMTTQASAQMIIKFDAPNAGAGKFQGTIPTAINLEDAVTRNVTDSANGTHGFLNNPNGDFAPDFDVPGACACLEWDLPEVSLSTRMFPHRFDLGAMAKPLKAN